MPGANHTNSEHALGRVLSPGAWSRDGAGVLSLRGFRAGSFELSPVDPGRHGNGGQGFSPAAVTVQILRGAAQQRRRVSKFSDRKPGHSSCQGATRAFQLSSASILHLKLPTCRSAT